MSWIQISLLAVHSLACILLILLVLIQKDRGGGLAGAFGGGSLGTPFGIRTATVLTKATAVLFGIAAVTALGLVWLSRPGPAE